MSSYPEANRLGLIHSMPILLTRNVQEEIERAARDLPAGDAARVAPVLKELSELRSYYQAHMGQYPIGAGPIEKIFQQVQAGESTPEQAEEQAAQGVAYVLGPLYVSALSASNLKMAREGQWREAALMQKLLLRALHTFEQSGSMGDAGFSAVFDWIEIVHVYVYELPDPRLFYSAVEEGEALIAEAQKAGKAELVGEVSHRLGTLYLDPYAARSSHEYDKQMAQWRQRFYDSMGPQIAALKKPDRDMPEPVKALQKAERYLTQAAKLRSSERRGFSLKALAQAVQWQTIVGKKDRKKALGRICGEALKALSPTESPEEWISVLNMRDTDADASETETLERILSISWDSHVDKLGTPKTLDLISQAAQFFQGTDTPERALRLMIETRPLFELGGSETRLVGRWAFLLTCLGKIAKLPKEARKGPAASRREKMLAASKQENWDPGRVAAALLWLANTSQETNDEELGLQLLAEASRCAPVLVTALQDLIEYQRILLWMGLGVNGVNSENWGQAVQGYARSLSGALQHDWKDMHTELVRRIDDLSNKGGDVATSVAGGLVPVSLKIYRSLGEAGGYWLRNLTKRTLAGMGRSTNPEVLSLLCQFGKGARFAAALAAGACYQWRSDSEADRMLELIADSEAKLKSTAVPPPDIGDTLLDESLVLCSYGDSTSAKYEDSPWQRLYNLQRSFDTHVNNKLLSYAGDETRWYLLLDDIQASLDSRTVLLNFYLGATAQGTIGVSAVAITREDVRAGIVGHPFPDSSVDMEGSNIRVNVHPLALTVANLRQEILYSPGPGRVITPEGERSLSSDVRAYFGYLLEYLQEMRAKGKDHICIVPHGPLHFYPFHLLGDAGSPLAANTIVTYLPNLALLLAPRGNPSVSRYRPHALSALGLTFQEVTDFGLDELPGSVQETESIASLFDTRPVLERDATEQAVTEAFLNSRYVHLSTHGAHNISAPAFQCLFLAPKDDADGRLYAHEVLKMDLRGLEMLTLSACETALGRFDQGDNLRGLPSAFLQSGVSTIVGTLWPVRPAPAELFFTHLYAGVKKNLDRRDAFYLAQQETRKAFPIYKDWGAFYYIGAWR
jgi:hypothetical protein